MDVVTTRPCEKCGNLMTAPRLWAGLGPAPESCQTCTDRLVANLFKGWDDAAVDRAKARNSARLQDLFELDAAYEQWLTGQLDSDDHERLQQAIEGVLASHLLTGNST